MIDVPVGRKPANTGLVVTVTECDYDFMILMLFIAVFVQFFVILMWYSAMLFFAAAGRRPRDRRSRCLADGCALRIVQAPAAGRIERVARLLVGS
jgi:hypothetical protein